MDQKKKNLIAFLSVMGFGLLVVLLMLYGKYGGSHKSGGLETRARVAQDCFDITKRTLSGFSVSYDLDEERDTFTLFIGEESIKKTGVSAKAGYKNSQESWKDLTDKLLSICGSLQKRFVNAGHGTTVAVCAVDPEDHDKVFLMVSKGKVLYDATKD